MKQMFVKLHLKDDSSWDSRSEDATDATIIKWQSELADFFRAPIEVGGFVTFMDEDDDIVVIGREQVKWAQIIFIEGENDND